MENQAFNWREHLGVHPAAELFPSMSEAELKVLADDILKNGLNTDIVVWDGPEGGKVQLLLDGRNRLDALAMNGLLCVDDNGCLCFAKRWCWTPGSKVKKAWIDERGDRIRLRHVQDDPFAIAVSLNIHRRHLTAKQKRQLIADLLKGKLEASDRQIAKQVNADHKTVGKVRSKAEGRGEIPHAEKRTDSKGRRQPAKKPKAAKPEPAPASKPDITKRPANDPKPKPLDFEKVKAKVAELEQQFVDLEIQQCLIRAQQAESVKQANLTPSQAREIKKLSDESDRKLDDILARHQLGTEEEYYDIAHRVILEDDDRKRFIKQARNPQKALDDDREQEQLGEMECDRDDARQQARENEESWSEVKDEWEADWIQNNWTEGREQEFLLEFKAKWRRNHRQEFPNSDFAPTSKTAKAAA